MSHEGQPPYSSSIVPEFAGRHTNLFAYPERGPWGDPKYPGNFTGKFVLDLIDIYKAQSVADPFAGGGTTEDVCRAFGIPYWTGDLREGFDILEDAIPACSDGTSPELVMFHPPYFDMISYLTFVQTTILPSIAMQIRGLAVGSVRKFVLKMQEDHVCTKLW